MYREKVIVEFDYIYFAEELKRVRNLEGISMRDLGEKLGMTHVTVSRVENEQIKPQLETILKFINYFNMNISEFFKESYDILT